MPPKTKSSSDHPLLGQPSTVLRQEFLQAHQEGSSDVDILPFKGPLQLPSKGQVLKLYLFYRDETSSKNHVQANITAKQVAKQVFKYWDMAGYQVMVMPRIENHILKLADAYKTILKGRARNSQTEISKREDYLAGLNQLFDIARKDLEEILRKDRLLAADDKDDRYRVKEGYTRKMEDITFLLDQRTERKMIMGARDKSYEERLDKNLKKRNKVDEAATCSGESSKNILDSLANDELEGDESEGDEDYCENTRTKKSTTFLRKVGKLLVLNLLFLSLVK